MPNPERETMNNSDIVISTKNLSKVYKLYKNPKDRLKEALSLSGKIYHKDFYALKDINLEIKRGEVIGIVGKNGSGKSTLLKILSRVLTPSSGEFMVKGKVSSLLELGSGFNPELTGLENVYFYGTILGFSEEKIKEKLPEILDFADIGDFIYQPLKTYSSGMRARLAFSVAINVDPDILILDEVLAVGDELFRRKCYARMESFFKGRKTILFVSHSVSDINQLCSRAIMLNNGELIIDGISKTVTSLYQKYLYSPTRINLIKEIKILNEHLKADQVIGITATSNQTVNQVSINQLKVDEKFESLVKLGLKNEMNQGLKPYNIPSLKPITTIKSGISDVLIDNVKITTLLGETVNALLVDDEYRFTYRAKFRNKEKNVFFGIAFKSEKGLKLSGSNTSYFDNIIDEVKPDEVFIVSCRFTCYLLPGNYFTNINIISFKDSEIMPLCKIDDAFMFKVQPMSRRVYNGIISLNQSFEIEKIPLIK